MKTYKVTLQLIVGYHNNDIEQPMLKSQDFTVRAANEGDAIVQAKSQDKSSYSIYESYVDEV